MARIIGRFDFYPTCLYEWLWFYFRTCELKKNAVDDFPRYFIYDLLKNSVLFLLYSLHPWKNIHNFIMKIISKGYYTKDEKIIYSSISWELCFKLKVTVKYKASFKCNCWFVKQNVFCFIKIVIINIDA